MKNKRPRGPYIHLSKLPGQLLLEYKVILPPNTSLYRIMVPPEGNASLREIDLIISKSEVDGAIQVEPHCNIRFTPSDGETVIRVNLYKQCDGERVWLGSGKMKYHLLEGSEDCKVDGNPYPCLPLSFFIPGRDPRQNIFAPDPDPRKDDSKTRFYFEKRIGNHKYYCISVSTNLPRTITFQEIDGQENYSDVHTFLPEFLEGYTQFETFLKGNKDTTIEAVADAKGRTEPDLSSDKPF